LACSQIFVAFPSRADPYLEIEQATKFLCGAPVTPVRGACLNNKEEDTTMSVNEIQALAQRFADAFDKNDMKSALEMMSEDVE
jgi:hypothetical protein